MARLHQWAFFVLLSLPGIAAAEGVNVHNGPDCGQWIEQRSASNARAYEFFMVGYINGLSRGFSIEFWRRDGHDLSWEQVSVWTDAFCRANPLLDLNDAAISLYAEHTGNLWLADPAVVPGDK